MHFWLRNLRGWIYRRYPASRPVWYRKKRTGYERRWGLEKRGFTKEGFFQVFRRHVLAGLPPGAFFELVAGDGLVGSWSSWLEELGEGWRTVAWEHRSPVADRFARHRPAIPLHQSRLTKWSEFERNLNPVGVITRGVREASGVCRAVRQGWIRPKILGIWNPSRRPVWYRRLHREGYRLELVWQNVEFYRCPQK